MKRLGAKLALAVVLLGATLVSAQPFRSGPGLTVVSGGGGGVTGLTSWGCATDNAVPLMNGTTATDCSSWTEASNLLTSTSATGLGLGTATPKTILGVARTNDSVLHVLDADFFGFLVAGGPSGAITVVYDSDGTVDKRIGALALNGGVLTISRWTDGFGAEIQYLKGDLATDAVTLGSASVAGVVLSPGTGDVTVASGERLGYAVQSATCADNGNGGTAGTLTLQPTSNVITFTNSDAQGCTVTMSETAPLAGMPVTIIVISNAGGTVDFADSAGVLEIGTTVSLALDDALTLMYANSAWYAMAYKDN